MNQIIQPVLEQARDKRRLYVFFKQIPPLLIRLECAWMKFFFFSDMNPRHWPICARHSVVVSTSRAEKSATLENETTLSRNVGHQTSSQAVPYLIRMETSTVPLRKPKNSRMLEWFLGKYLVQWFVASRLPHPLPKRLSLNHGF